MEDLEQQLVSNYEKFLTYNNFRIERLLTLMNPKKQPLYHLLPFLLHVNQPEFPGYIEGEDAVQGVFKYRPNQQTNNYIEKFFPGSRGKEIITDIPAQNCVVKSLLLMGSLGTIAQSPDSDFDFWVCVTLEKLTGDQIKCLEKKLLAIETWADDAHALEVHFFITDIKSVRTNKFGEADKESAGTSQAKLLKEEFYRTTIFVAGKVPLWWIISPELNDSGYRQCKEVIKKSRQITPEKLIDLGHLTEISSDEFFGAAIWQICKAMDSPYKSVLKMAMLTVFLDPEKKEVLLCEALKLRVQKPGPQQKELTYYDPYIILFDTILRYYQNKDMPDTLDLFRTCLYIKTGIKAGRDLEEKQNLNFKEKIISKYVTSWKWDQAKLNELSSFRDWEFEKVRDLGNRVHKFLIEAYQDLSRMLKQDGNRKQMISPQDITVIGRKLESFYSVKKGKVNFMKRAFSEGLLQESITMNADPNKPPQQLWSVYRGQLGDRSLKEAVTQKKLLKKGPNLVEILAWAIFNQLIDKNTSLYLLPNPSPVSMGDIQDFVSKYMEIFPKSKISMLSNSALLAKDKKLSFFIIVNFGSQKWQTEIEKVTIIYKNSWGEIYCISEEKKGREFLSQFMQTVSLEESNVEEASSKFIYFVPQGKSHRAICSSIDDIINTSYLSNIKEA